MKGYQTNPVLNHPAVLKAAADAQRSPAQVVLRWALQHGQVSPLQHNEWLSSIKSIGQAL